MATDALVKLLLTIIRTRRTLNTHVRDCGYKGLSRSAAQAMGEVIRAMERAERILQQDAADQKRSRTFDSAKGEGRDEGLAPSET